MCLNYYYPFGLIVNRITGKHRIFEIVDNRNNRITKIPIFRLTDIPVVRLTYNLVHKKIPPAPRLAKFMIFNSLKVKLMNYFKLS